MTCIKTLHGGGRVQNQRLSLQIRRFAGRALQLLTALVLSDVLVNSNPRHAH